jgi:hypothetical protein
MDPLAENPFFVLGLEPRATPMEIERQGLMVLAKLELGLEAAAWHKTPFGRRRRSADDVRRAMQALADPQRRLVAEAFADAACSDDDDTNGVGVNGVGVGVDDDTDARGVDVAALVWWHPGAA